MGSRVNITFAPPAVVQGRVYVVSELSSPPWTPLEMVEVSGSGAESDKTIYIREFEANLDRDVYQYKIRIGDDNWVLDGSRPTAVDADGNTNNVIRIPSHTAGTPENKSDTTAIDSSENESENLLDAQYRNSNDEEEPRVLLHGPSFPYESGPSSSRSDDLSRLDDGLHLPHEPGLPDESESDGDAPPVLHLSVQEVHQGGDLREAFRSHTWRGQDHPGVLPHELDLASQGSDTDGDYEDQHPYRQAPLRKVIPGVDSSDSEEDDELLHGKKMPHERDFAVRPSVGVAWPNRGEEDPQAPHLTVDTDMSSDYPNDYGNELERGQQLPHERSLSAIESVPEEKVDSTSNPASPAFGRPGFNSFTFRPSRSCLPHSMPRSDDEDPYLKGNLELFPSNREGIYQQIERTESLVPEDVPEKACFATELSATELSAVASHTSLTAIVEIREQEEEEEEESSSDPSSPLEFGRNVQARKNPLATLYGPLNDANTSARNEASGADRSSTAHHDTYDGTSAGGVASKGSHAGDLMGMDGLTTSASADDNSALHPLTLSTSAHNKNEDDATSDSGSEDSIQSADVITTTPPPHSPIVVDHAQGAEPTVPESENSATAFPIDGEKTTNVSEKQKYTSVTESSPITPATAKNNKGTANNPHRDDLISAMVGSDAKLGERMYSDLTTPAPPQEPTTKPERGGRFAGMLGAVRRLVVACFGTGSHFGGGFFAVAVAVLAGAWWVWWVQ